MTLQGLLQLTRERPRGRWTNADGGWSQGDEDGRRTVCDEKQWEARAEAEDM